MKQIVQKLTLSLLLVFATATLVTDQTPEKERPRSIQILLFYSMFQPLWLLIMYLISVRYRSKIKLLRNDFSV